MPYEKIIFVVLFLVTFFFKTDKLIAQNWDYSYTHFTKEDGLPSNIVYHLVNDNDGFIWLGTDAGLVRFDGSHFITYTTEDGLPSNDVLKLTCDSKNRVWINSMSKEICYYQNGKIHNKYNTPFLNKIEIKKQILDILEDKDSTIWITSEPYDIYKINKEKVVKESVNEQLNRSLNYNGKIYLFSKVKKKNNPYSDGLVILDDTIIYSTDKKLIKTPLSSYKKDMFNLSVLNWVVVADKNKNVWKLSKQGLISYNYKSGVKNNIYLPNYKVSRALYDINNNFWIATLGNGLYKVNNNYVRVYLNNQYKNYNYNQSICLTPKYIYVGNNNCQLDIIERNTGKLIHSVLIDKFGIKGARILKISTFNQCIILTTDEGTYAINKNNLQIKKITIETDKNHVINNDTIILLKRNCFLKMTNTFQRFDSISVDKRCYSYCNFFGDELIGTENGILKYENKKIRPYNLNEKTNFRIMDMLKKDSILFLATINNGVYLIKNRKVVNKLNLKNGLSCNNCYKLQVLNDNLYISTNNGLNVYNLKTKKIINIFESNGLVSNMVNDFVVEKDTVYAATEKGISIIPLQKLDTAQKLLLFSKPVIVGNDTLWNRDSIFETYTNKRFVINLNALSYIAKGNVVFYYKLNNIDSNFTATKDQMINLKFIKSGYYEFIAYATDINGTKSQLLKIKIIVKSYFWQTIWFKIIAILFFLLFIYIIFKYQIQKVKNNELKLREKDTKIHQLELSVWRSKINPHFLFNSLNSIVALINMNKYDNAVEYINDFSIVLRKTIQSSDKLFNIINEEIILIESLLKLEMMKRENKFYFSIKLGSPDIKYLFFPTLLIQPVIENSLKHGIKSNPNGKILISFYEHGDKIICTVEDNGDGINDKAIKNTSHRSMGINLIKDKIKIIEEIIHAKIEFIFKNKTDVNNTGTITIFVIPKITKEKYVTYNNS